MTEWVYGYDELAEILRGDGSAGFVGVSAIDGLIAAVVAGPAALQPMEWLPLIFGGRMPAAPPGSPNQRVVNTIIKRHAEVTEILASHPADYRPMFMNQEGQVIIYDWTVGFMMGLSAARDAWVPLMLSENRHLLRPILVANELGQGCLPDLSRVEMERIRRTAHNHIADAVVALHKLKRKNSSRPRRTAKTARRP